MTIQGCALDLEGTIIDVEKAHHEGHLATANELGVFLDFEQAVASIPGFVGGGDEAVAKGLHSLLETPPPVDEILARLKHHYYRKLAENTVASRPFFGERFRELRARQPRLAIGSLTPRKEAERLLKRAGVSQLLSGLPMIFREDVVHVKPHPEVFLKTARVLGVSPTKQLVFEDSPVGVAAARAAGSLVVAVPTLLGLTMRESLMRAGALRVYSGWHELDIAELMTLERDTPLN